MAPIMLPIMQSIFDPSMEHVVEALVNSGSRVHPKLVVLPSGQWLACNNMHFQEKKMRYDYLWARYKDYYVLK